MTLQKTLEYQGNWLFCRRSYLPLLLLPLLCLAIYSSGFLAEMSEGFLEYVWMLASMLIAFGGLGIRLYVVGHVPKNTSGRNTTRQRAEVLNTTGLYSIVRHPLYLGNFVIILGITLSVQVWWFILITITAFWIYYERIMFAEEEFLLRSFGPEFQEWAARTPAFFPKCHLWKSPSLSFSFKTGLKREYSSFFGIVAAFTGIEIIRNLITEGAFELDGGWIVFCSVGASVYLVLRTLRKNTTVLSVEGR